MVSDVKLRRGPSLGICIACGRIPHLNSGWQRGDKGIVPSKYHRDSVRRHPEKRKPFNMNAEGLSSRNWLPGPDSNQRPSGYEGPQYFCWARTISSPALVSQGEGVGRSWGLLVGVLIP